MTKEDGKKYSCTASNSQGEKATGHILLRAIEPPKISPFTFDGDLKEGDRSQVGCRQKHKSGEMHFSGHQVSCTISSGDMPIEIEWKKDGETFDPPTDIQVNPLPSAAASIVLPTDSIVLPALRPSGSHYPGCHQVQNNVFSSNILFFSLRASHSGSYTCIATNKAAAVNFTAQLIVRGAFSLFALLAAES